MCSGTKKSMLLLLLFCCFGTPGFAQKWVFALFKTATQYSTNRPFIQLDTTIKRIWLHPMFRQGYVLVEKISGKQIISKDSLYGYRTKEGQYFRFYGNLREEYEILECGSICMYKRIIPDYSSKIPQSQVRYYFSLDFGSPIVELSLRNLKKTFVSNCSLELILDTEFKEESSLSQFNSKAHMYQLNYILKSYL